MRDESCGGTLSTGEDVMIESRVGGASVMCSEGNSASRYVLEVVSGGMVGGTIGGRTVG